MKLSCTPGRDFQLRAITNSSAFVRDTLHFEDMIQSNNNILRNHFKSTEFEINKILYIMHRLPRDNVSNPKGDNIDVMFLKEKYSNLDTLSLFLFIFSPSLEFALLY